MAESPQADLVQEWPEQIFERSPKLCIALGFFISDVISASSEAEIFATLARNLKDLIPNDRASVTLLNSDDSSLDIFALHGSEGMLPLGMSVPLENTYTGRAVISLKGQLRHLREPESALDGQLLLQNGLTCCINAPLVVGGRGVGAINAATSSREGYSHISLQFLLLIARLVSTNLERQRLLMEKAESEQRYRCYSRQLEMLNRLAQQLSMARTDEDAFAICKQTIQDILPAKRISFARYLSETEQFEVQVLSGVDVLHAQTIDAAGTVLQQALIQQAPLYCADLSDKTFVEQGVLHQQGLRWSWSIPVKVKGSTVGILNMASDVTERCEKNDNLMYILGALGASLGSTLERLEVQGELTQLANFDTVTGLPNRRMIYQQIDNKIAAQEPAAFSVLFIDLDKFKSVNDTYGHQFGDELLCMVAKRIREVVSQPDIVARIGGDEFLALLDENDAANHGPAIAQRIIHSLTQSFSVGDTLVSIGASIGIRQSSTTDRSAEAIVRDADMAMYDAKSAGRNTFCELKP